MRHHLLPRIAMLTAIAVLGCGTNGGRDEAPPPLAAGEGLGTFWVQRTDAELAVELQAACMAASTRGQPVLLWISAAWCGDCRRHLAHEKAGRMDAELAHWQRVVIEPGRFDRHTDLLQTFGVSAVPFGIATRPTDCTRPATAWPVLDSGRFDRPLLDGDTDRLERWMRDVRDG